MGQVINLQPERERKMPVQDMTVPNLLNDPDFKEYLEENQVSEEETPIAFAQWLKEESEPLPN